MVDILFTYNNPHPLSYGGIFLDAGASLQKRGFEVGFLNLPEFVRTYDLTPSYLEETVAKMQPKVVISHQASLGRSLNEAGVPIEERQFRRLLEVEIDEFFIERYWGRIQTNSPNKRDDSLEFKEGFVRRLRDGPIPIPKSVIKGETGEWSYSKVREKLYGDSERRQFVLKDVTSTFGHGVYFVPSEEDFVVHPNVRIAQEEVVNDVPCGSSLRLITFPGEIIGAFLFYNREDSQRSINSDNFNGTLLNEGGVSWAKCNDPQVREAFPYNFVNPDLTIREDVRALIIEASKLPSQSLLRAMDVIGDNEGNPYFLEAQTLPGNPEGLTYPLIAGLPSKGLVYSHSAASHLLANSLANLLKTNDLQ